MWDKLPNETEGKSVNDTNSPPQSILSSIILFIKMIVISSHMCFNILDELDYLYALYADLHVGVFNASCPTALVKLTRTEEFQANEQLPGQSKLHLAGSRLYFMSHPIQFLSQEIA